MVQFQTIYPLLVEPHPRFQRGTRMRQTGMRFSTPASLFLTVCSPLSPPKTPISADLKRKEAKS